MRGLKGEIESGGRTNKRESEWPKVFITKFRGTLEYFSERGTCKQTDTQTVSVYSLCILPGETLLFWLALADLR